MDSSQDKQLPASARKLQKTRAKGQAARSRDALHLAVLGSGALLLWLGGSAALAHLRLALARQLVFDAHTAKTPALMAERLAGMGASALLLVLPLAAVIALAALLAAQAAGGWVWSWQPLLPQFSRLNPFAGLARLFSRQQLVTVLKMVALTALLGAAGWWFLRHHMDAAAALAMQSLPLGLGAAGRWLGQGLALLLAVVLVLALVDVPVQGWLFRTRLRMSHEEAKQEHKEADGNPQVKSRLRQRQRQASERASVRAVARADFVLTNPTHYAVALRYDEACMAAPEVVAKGADLVALKIRESAAEHHVVLVESPVLARALYAHAPLNQPIPAALYTAVAQVLAYVWRLKAAQKARLPLPAALARPPEPQVSAYLDPQSKKRAVSG